MDVIQKGRIERYMLNAQRFLWGLLIGNQREIYSLLESKGFIFSRGKYSIVLHQLIRSPGIEDLLNNLIVKNVKETYPEKTLYELRKLWNIGEKPTINQLTGLQLKNTKDSGKHRANVWRPFVEINTQFEFVERWGELAGVWFEEIEPWLESQKKQN